MNFANQTRVQYVPKILTVKYSFRCENYFQILLDLGVNEMSSIFSLKCPKYVLLSLIRNIFYSFHIPIFLRR